MWGCVLASYILYIDRYIYINPDVQVADLPNEFKMFLSFKSLGSSLRACHNCLTIIGHLATSPEKMKSTGVVMLFWLALGLLKKASMNRHDQTLQS